MNIKIIKLMEKIGAVLLAVSVIFMILNDVENNPIPEMTDQHQYIGIIGIILWFLGYRIRIGKEKKKIS